MKAASQPGVALDLEDFRRLGVRPHETRTAIIRSAAIRSCKSLADKHLRTADSDMEVQLTRIATSTYRLLDPRQRDSDTARTQVGRILPLALRLAGQTRFGDSSLHSSLDEAFHQGGPAEPQVDEFEEWEFEDWNGYDPSGRYPENSSEWDPAPIGDHSVANRRHFAAFAATSVLAVAAVALLIFVVSISSNSDPTTAELGNGQDANAWERSDFQALPLEFAETDSDSASNPSVVDRSGALQFTSADLAPIDPPSLTSRVPAEPADGSEESVFQRPNDDQVRQARLTLQMRFPELRRLALPSQVNQQIQILKQAEVSFDRGSVEDWTCQLLIAELSWLVDSPSKLRPRLQSVADRYGQPVDLLAAGSFEAACRLASLPETHRHLIQNGVSLADTLLVNESFEASRRIVRALSPSVESLDDNESSLEISALSDAIDQAEHLSTVAAKTQSEDLDGDDRATTTSSITGSSTTGRKWGVTGRYYCLYLRRWDVGLPWLPEAADSRIASAARRELALEPSASVEQVRDIATLWLTLASRADGRVADSMRMHGIEMLESLVPKSSGLQKLDLRRQIQSESSRLPSYLRRSVVTG